MALCYGTPRKQIQPRPASWSPLAYILQGCSFWDLFSYSSAFLQRWWKVGMKLGDANIMGGASFFAGKAFSDTATETLARLFPSCVLSALCGVSHRSRHGTYCSLVPTDYACLPPRCELDGGRCSVPFPLLCHLCRYRQLSYYTHDLT